jgi:hypothetical protein
MTPETLERALVLSDDCDALEKIVKKVHAGNAEYTARIEDLANLASPAARQNALTLMLHDIEAQLKAKRAEFDAL